MVGVAELAAEGTRLYASGSYARSADVFTNAVALLAASPQPDMQQTASVLNSRAACLLKLDEPLRANDDAWDAVVACCDREALDNGIWKPLRWATSSGAFLKAVSRRTAACEAAGCALSALPELLFACSLQKDKITEALARTLSLLLNPSLRKPSSGAGVVPAAAEELRVSSSPAPCKRRGAASACCGGSLFVFGGQSDDFEALGDAWRLRLGASSAGGASPSSAARASSPPQRKWEEVSSPRGPPADVSPLGCSAGGSFVVLSRGVVWSLREADSSRKTPSLSHCWIKGARVWPGTSSGRHDGAALAGAPPVQSVDLPAVCAVAYVYSHTLGVFRVPLLRDASGAAPCPAAVRLHAPGGRPGDGVPCCLSPLLWPQVLAPQSASSPVLRLFLYGGSAPEPPGAAQPEMEGFNLLSPPPLRAMWTFDVAAGCKGGAWAPVAHGGGGAPPPPRAEAGLAPHVSVGDEAPTGVATLVGGYSECDTHISRTFPSPAFILCLFQPLSSSASRPGCCPCSLATAAWPATVTWTTRTCSTRPSGGGARRWRARRSERARSGSHASMRPPTASSSPADTRCVWMDELQKTRLGVSFSIEFGMPR